MSEVRECAIADALALVGERWALLVVRELFWGNHRFSGIAARTGAPRDVLTARLKSLCEAGIVERRPDPGRPAWGEYHLTASGRALKPVLWSLQEWALAEFPRAAGQPATAFVPHHDHALDPESHFTCRTCGEGLG